MIWTNSERFLNAFDTIKRAVSFPLEDKHVVNKNHVIRKTPWPHTEKKMSSRGAFQCTTWLVWNKLAASKTLLWRRQKNSWVSRFTERSNKKARKLFKKEKSCTKSEKLFEGLIVAPNLKSCSKVAEQLMYDPTVRSFRRSFVCSFVVRSFVRSFTYSAFIGASVRPTVSSSIRSIVCLCNSFPKITFFAKCGET